MSDIMTDVTHDPDGIAPSVPVGAFSRVDEQVFSAGGRAIREDHPDIALPEDLRAYDLRNTVSSQLLNLER